MKKSSLRITFLSVAAMAQLVTFGIGATTDHTPVLIPNTQQLDVYSSASHRKYRIFIYIPASPPRTQEGYPIVYVLDGNDLFMLAAGAARLQATSENEAEPIVIVGIGYDGDTDYIRRQRYFDLTPPTEASSSEFGGAPEFLQFIEADLKPVIERKIPINRGQQTLLGHSLGGLFVLYTLFERSGAFSNYISASPSLWWDHKALLKYVDGNRDAIAARIASKRLLIAVGKREPPSMVEDSQRLFSLLTSSDVPLPFFCFNAVPDENHMSMMSVITGRLVGFLQDNLCSP